MELSARLSAPSAGLLGRRRRADGRLRPAGGHETSPARGVTAVFQDYLYNFLLFTGAGFCIWRGLAVRAERAAWLIMGVGIVAWTGADIVWTFVYADEASPPYPSISDALWLLYYPTSLATLTLLVARAPARRRRGPLARRPDRRAGRGGARGALAYGRSCTPAAPAT